MISISYIFSDEIEERFVTTYSSTLYQETSVSDVYDEFRTSPHGESSSGVLRKLSRVLIEFGFAEQPVKYFLYKTPANATWFFSELRTGIKH